MIIDLRKLSTATKFEIDEDIEFNEEYYKNLMQGINNCHFRGTIYYNEIENIVVSGNCVGTMVLQDAITLENIDKPFNIEINEEITRNNDFRLEIIPILWENIVLEVPISYKSEKNESISYSGDGWSLNNEE